MEPEEHFLEDEDYKEKKEKNVYRKEVLDNLVEDDEISPEEEAFMQGYDEDQEE